MEGMEAGWHVKTPLAKFLHHRESGNIIIWRRRGATNIHTRTVALRLYYSFSFPKTKICGLSDKLFCLSKVCFNCNLAWKHNIVGNLKVILNTPFYGLSFVCVSVGGNGNLKKKIKVHKIVVFSYTYL